jgi:Rrf2 family transcriptional regulator, iron-sulfur cluster assembly transcription factor
MKIGTKGHYAVAAMMELAKKTDLKKPIPLNMLSSDQSISVHYLELLFIKLKKAGLVKSIRGAHGGYLLMKPASQISVYDIIVAVGEKVRVTRCENAALVSCFNQTEKCALHALWSGLDQKIYDYLIHISLEGLLERATLPKHVPLKMAPEMPTYKTNCF